MQQTPWEPPPPPSLQPRRVQRRRRVLVILLIMAVIVSGAGLAFALASPPWETAADRVPAGSAVPDPAQAAAPAAPKSAPETATNSAQDGATKQAANTAAKAADAELTTYHHEGFGVWFEHPSEWRVKPFKSEAAAEARGFITFRGCGNQDMADLAPVRVLDEQGREVAALGISGGGGGCAGEPPKSTVRVIEETPVPLSGRAPVNFVYLTTSDGQGGRYPVLGLTDDRYGKDSLGHHMSFYAQSETPAHRYALSFASTVAFDQGKNRADAGDSELPAFESQRKAKAFAETPEYKQLRAMYLSTRYAAPAGALNGDLGLVEPISYPACDGSQIAVLGTSWKPKRYESEIREYLAAFPGSKYTRTDFLCSSFLRPELGNSDDAYIYLVYVPTGDDRAATCRAVADAKPHGGNAHGKWLRNEGEPGEQVPC